jgi:hypothetical protein
MIRFTYIFLIMIFICLLVCILKNMGKMTKSVQFKVLLMCEYAWQKCIGMQLIE